jgi:hypothetical protein
MVIKCVIVAQLQKESDIMVIEFVTVSKVAISNWDIILIELQK